MSRILGVFTPDRLPDREGIGRMLRALAGRGADESDTWTEGGSALAVSRHAWELGDGFSGPVRVAREDDLVVAADATLFYRDDLRRKLAATDVRVGGSTPSHLILAAYRAWGERCAERLEGDFAFVLWDRARRRAFCSRDFGGKRPLFHAEFGDTLVVASNIQTILAHPRCPRT